MRKIDIFNHVHPQAYFEKVLEIGGQVKDMGKRTRGIPMLRDLDARFRVMDEFGEGYSQVLTIPGPQPAILATPEQSPELARIGNDGLAELVKGCSVIPVAVDSKGAVYLASRKKGCVVKCVPAAPSTVEK